MNALKVILVSVIFLTFAFSLSPSRAGMHGDTKSGGHGEMGHTMEGAHGKSMKGHGSTGESIFEGTAFGRGVKGSMVDVTATMEKKGGPMSAPLGLTHHFMVTPDTPFEKGTGGKVVVTYPGGEKKEVKLQAMGKHMGGDLNLGEKGKYEVTCTLTEGGKHVSFTFEYEVK